MNVMSCPEGPQESSGRQSCMTQAAGSLQLPLAHSLGGCISDQEEQTGRWEYFPYFKNNHDTLNVCCLKETLIALFDLILMAPLHS